MNEIEGVSIIICCYNSSGRIEKTLEHLQNIRTEIPWEVIIVDNNSDDNTTDVVNSTWRKNAVTKMRIVSEKNRGLMNARVKGVAESTYHLLSFIDDDNYVESSWIDKVSEIMIKDLSIAACGGCSEAVFEKNKPEWFDEFAGSFAVGHQQEFSGYVIPSRSYLWGAGLTVRKSAWRDLFESGFKSMLKGRTGKSLSAGEDSELCFSWLLRGWKLWYDDTLKLKHFIPASRATESYLEKMYEGFGKAEVMLSVYRRFVIDSNSDPSWFVQLSTSFKNLIRSAVKFILYPGKLKSKIVFRHDKAFFMELLFSKQKYESLKKSVGNLKSENRKNTLVTILT